MAISNFKLPTGLEVSGTTTITGSVGVSQTLTAVNLTASGDISGSTGNFANLFKDGSAVLTSADLSSYALSADVSASFAQSADVSASFVQGVDLTGTVAFLTASNVFTNSQQITGGLSMTEDLFARTASLSGDLTVAGNLTVQGATTYIDSTTVNIGDTNINLGTGSTDLAVLDGGGLDLGTSAEVQWRYDNANTAWTSNVDINLSASKSLKLDGVVAVSRQAGSNSLSNSTNGYFAVTNTGISAVSASLTASVIAPLVSLGSPATNVTTLSADNTFISGTTAIYLSSSNIEVTGVLNIQELSASNLSASNIQVSDIDANVYGSHPTNTIVITAGATGSLPVFAVSRAGAAKYILKASSSSDVHTLESLVTHNGSNAYYTSYASLYSTSPMIRLVASADGVNVTVEVENFSAGSVTLGYLIQYVY